MDWKVKAVRTPKRRCWYEKSKVCYDKKSAITAANLRFKQDKIKLRAYWCNKCNFFHLTKRLENIWNDEEEYRTQQKNIAFTFSTGTDTDQDMSEM